MVRSLSRASRSRDFTVPAGVAEFRYRVRMRAALAEYLVNDGRLLSWQSLDGWLSRPGPTRWPV